MHDTRTSGRRSGVGRLRSGTIDVVTGPSEPPSTPSDLGVDLAAATELVVELGGAFDTYPYVEQPDLLVVTDLEMVRQVVRELAAADLTPGVVLPALPGLTLTFRDGDGDHLGSVDVLGERWLRSWWSSDALLPAPLSLLRDDNDLHQYVRAGWAAVDAVAPASAAAGDGDGVEHATAPDGGTLCGLPDTDVEVYRHLFAYRGQDCQDCYRLAWEHRDPPTWPPVHEHAEALSSMWTARWGTIPPAGDMLRNAETWVRFHSLPRSKRYAETPQEYDELLRRHHIVLHELAATTGSEEVLVLTLAWSCSALPVPRSAPLQAAVPDATYWASFQDPGDPEAWSHTFVDRLPLTPEALDPLLRLVADDGATGVILCDADLTWFFHPYDGGADVIPATTTVRDELRARHRAWLSTTESGL